MQAQGMLSKKLSNLHDNVKYLRQMARENRSGQLGQQLRALATS